MRVVANPVVQVGNFVASNQSGQSGSTPTFIIYVSDPAANPVAEDIEGMNFTVQLAGGTGTSPAITTVDLTSNTVWTGNVNGPFGGIDPASGNGAQWQSYAVTTSFDTNTNTGTVINPNGALANITLNTAGASTGTITFRMTGTKDPTRDSAFSDGLGNTVPSSITNGTLTIVNNPVVYWTGATNVWDTTSNWSSAAAPTVAQDASFANHIPASGATINLASGPETVNNLWFDGSYTLSGGKISLGGGKVTVFGGSNAAINSEIDGAAGLTLTGGGNLTLGGSTSNAYSGDTNVIIGTLTLAKSGGAVAIPGGNLNVNGSATVQFNAPAQTGSQIAVTLTNATAPATMALAAGANQVVGSISGDGTIAFPATLGPSLAVGNNSADNVFAGAITGAGNLIKRNNNTLTFSGASLSVGAVTVNGGTLTFSTVAPNLSGTTLGGSWTVNGGTLNLPAGSNATTIISTGSVTLGAPTASFPALNGLSNNQGSFTVSGGKSFTTAGALTNDGGVTVSGASSNLAVAGGLANTGTPGATGSTTVNTGSALSAIYIRQSILTVTGSASINTQANGGGTSVLSALALGGTASSPLGKLDIADNKLIVNDSTGSHANTAATIISEVNAAADFDSVNIKPRWDGNGITSSKLVTGGVVDVTHSLGVVDNALPGAKTTFGGQNVNSASILVGYTLSGDANLDGQVTFGDFQSLFNDYGKGGVWQQGDFNHDGKVTFADFQLLFNNYGKSMPGAGQAFITAEQMQEVEAFAQSVPEPSTIGLLLTAAAIGLLKRRR